jgi:hypothetical protein
MLNVIMLNVIMLNVIMLNVIMLNVIMIMLNVIMLNVILLNVVMLKVVAHQQHLQIIVSRRHNPIKTFFSPSSKLGNKLDRSVVSLSGSLPTEWSMRRCFSPTGFRSATFWTSFENALAYYGMPKGLWHILL